MAGSLRAGSHNGRLAALVAKELTLAEADVTRISLADYPLPLLDADLLADSGPPDNAVKLKQMLSAHQGLFIASPEYTASVTPLLKNAIDWITRVRERKRAVRCVQGSGVCLGLGFRPCRRRPARALGVAADSGNWLRHAGSARTGLMVEKQTVRRSMPPKLDGGTCAAAGM
jgi:hypothetical protein